jgi:ATP-binding protein involved in chromosome partitioning
MKDDFSIKGEVIEALEGVEDPQKGKDLVTANMVEQVDVEGGVVDIVIAMEKGRDRDERFAIEDAVYDAVEAIAGVREVKVKMMSPQAIEREASGESAAPPEKPAPAPKSAPSAGSAAGGQGSVPASAPVDGVGKVIAVASGKGGVGKSTVAVNLALALKEHGYRVGVLDIYIYGPSLPTLLGVAGKPAVVERRIQPLEAQGVRLMSLGFLMEEDTPVIWRGPIVTGIIREFLRDVDWSGIDYLIVDMPPGTGDAQLALAQTVPVDGAIVVTTPSDLALLDAARGLQMFNTLNIDVIGIVENMSIFICPHCGEGTHIFGHDTVEAEAKRLGTGVLGAIPLDLAVRKGGDEGRPVVIAEPESDVTKAFLELAETVAQAQPLGDQPAGGEGEKKGLFSFLKS